MTLLTTGLPGPQTEREPNREQIVSVSCVLSLNMFKDWHGKAKNLFGGELRGHTRMIEKTMQKLVARLRLKASEDGFKGVHSIKFMTPVVVNGGCEIAACGTAFK